jgi:chromosome segregation ATPase
MNLKEQVKKEVEDFIFNLKLKNSNSITKISMYENMVKSFNDVMSDDQKSSNENFQNLARELESLRNTNEGNFKIIDDLNNRLKDFNGLYALKENEVQLKIVEKKALLRFKKSKLLESQNEFDETSRRIEEFTEKKTVLVAEEDRLKKEIAEHFDFYRKKIVDSNIDDLKKAINEYAFKSELSQDINIYENREYIESEEYSQASPDMRNYLNRIFNYKVFLSEKLKAFNLNIDFNEFKDKLYRIDAALVDLNKRIAETDLKIETAGKNISKRAELEKEISEIEKEIESFPEVLNNDRELLDKADSIRQHIR